jgi:hypothetical protein
VEKEGEETGGYGKNSKEKDVKACESKRYRNWGSPNVINNDVTHDVITEGWR